MTWWIGSKRERKAKQKESQAHESTVVLESQVHKSTVVLTWAIDYTRSLLSGLLTTPGAYSVGY
jgi:hypothetical protein